MWTSEPRWAADPGRWRRERCCCAVQHAARCARCLLPVGVFASGQLSGSSRMHITHIRDAIDGTSSASPLPETLRQRFPEEHNVWLH